MKKSILRLVTTAAGAEYFELNRNEPKAVLSTKEPPGRNRLYGEPLKRQDICSSRLLAVPSGGFKSVSVSSYPGLESLFQRPKDITTKFNPDACYKVWYDALKLGHNSLENMLRNMTTRAEITPYTRSRKQ